jgi:hypothetical protein
MRHLRMLVATVLVVIAVHTSAHAAQPGRGLGGWHETRTGNWAGMLAESGPADGVDRVTGAVVVPTLTCGPRTSMVSVWIGVGGQTGSMPQIGFHGTCESGRASYAGFMEWFDPAMKNNASVPLRGGNGNPLLVLAAGDLVGMTMTSTPSGQWHGLMTVSPSGGRTGAKRSSISFTVPRIAGSATGVGKTAECMVERTGRTGGERSFPLADFGTIHWKGCSVGRLPGRTGSAVAGHRVSARVLGGAWRSSLTSDAASYVSLTSFPVARYTMFDGSQPLASARASARTHDSRGDDRVRALGGFDVTWLAGGVGPTARPIHREVVLSASEGALRGLLAVPRQAPASGVREPPALAAVPATPLPGAVRVVATAVVSATCRLLQAAATTLRASQATQGMWTMAQLRRYRNLISSAKLESACTLV